MNGMVSSYRALVTIFGYLLFWSCLNSHAQSADRPAVLESNFQNFKATHLLGSELSIKPLHQNSKPSVSNQDLSAPSFSVSDVVQTTLAGNLSMRTAVNALLLQARRLAHVTRAEFSPKLSTSASAERSTSLAPGAAQANVQTKAALDLNWRLSIGANVKLSSNVTRSSQTGQLANTAELIGISISQSLLKGAGRVVNEASSMAAESAYRVVVKSLEQSTQALVAQALAAYIAVQQAQEATKQAQAAYQTDRKFNLMRSSIARV
jgi:outer membrane protein TolC